MDSHFLSWVFGVATLFGLLLQILDVFSQYKQIRNAISFVVFGVFLGTIIGAISPNSITFSLQFGWLEILLVSLALTVVLCVVTIEIRENSGNDGFATLAISAGLIFTIALIFGPIVRQGSNTDAKLQEFSIEELMAVKDFNIERRNYGKAIVALRRANNKMDIRDTRRAKIENEIEIIKLKQIE